MADTSKLVSFGWAGKQYTKHLWITYKITLEQFNQFWATQMGKCAGCEGQLAHPVWKTLEMGLRPEIDHDHKTGRVRGLLCRRCNDFLGKIKDNQDVLKNLIEYLERNGEHVI